MPLKLGHDPATIAYNIAEFKKGQTYQRTIRKFDKRIADSQATAVAMHQAALSLHRKYF